ncbi:MAG TPA: beta-ketoacyl-[acyl-carrier-protein] synthase family protein [Victivallales bacterium]|nr:beta-ketoacyl-[acyl-carrier-protein] synthase family protein [Victivallales bacterium]HRU02168.1 beta-ketoacyl-[acyl-carrier-protein] synthase family protein [Victivallales bacterium]
MIKIAISGRGLITPLGNGILENEKALKNGVSGIRFMPEWKELGLESLVAGLPDQNPPSKFLDSKNIRFMPANAIMALAAAEEALNEAKISPDDIRGKKVAVIIGCAGSAHMHLYENSKIFESTKKVKKVSPFVVPKVMASSAVANLSLILGLKGESFDVSSACASGAHAIITAARLINTGEYDIVITGGTEELNWPHALGFDAMRALSRKYNQNPTAASRPFDRNRDGFVIAAGAGILILESEKSLKQRGAKAISYISGFAANSNGTDMVVPDSNASAEVMKQAIESAKIAKEEISYINTHGTSTPMGDSSEMAAIMEVFGNNAKNIFINSTKSMTGHMIGASGAVETIFCSMMIEKKFISPSLNLDLPDESFEWANFVRKTIFNVPLKHVLNNSFGFGGTNASLIISSPDQNI